MKIRLTLAAIFVCVVILAGCPSPTTTSLIPTPTPTPTTPTPLGQVTFSGSAKFSGTPGSHIKLGIFYYALFGQTNPTSMVGTPVDLGTDPTAATNFSITVDFTNLGFTPATASILEFDMWTDANGNNIRDNGETLILTKGNTGGALFSPDQFAAFNFNYPYGITSPTWLIGYAGSGQVADAAHTGLVLKSDGSF